MFRDLSTGSPRWVIAALCSLGLLGGGCSPTPAPSGPVAHSGDGADHAHAHPTEGPHHGDLIELGNEEFHAEIVHATGGEVTVYILDSGATKAVPIEAAEVTINLVHGDETEQLKLLARPDSGDPEGRSSRFVSQAPHLEEDLDAEGATARLVVTINDKQYTGKIAHHHDHAGHAHDHAAESK